MIIDIDDSIVEGAISDNIDCLTFITDALTARRKGNVLINITKANTLKLLEIFNTNPYNYILKVVRDEVSFQREIILTFGIKRSFTYSTEETIDDRINVRGYCDENPIRPGPD